MTWTSPATWSVGQLVTAADLNTQLRDNLLALKNPPTAHYKLNESANYTTNSTVFVDVDATKLALTIVTSGGDVLVGFAGSLLGTSRAYLDVAVDGVAFGGDDGIMLVQNTGASVGASFVILVTGLAAGSHTFKLQYKVDSGSATLYAGAGTTSHDLHPQFWAREVS